MSPYKVDGVEITLQPTTGRWLPRYIVGRTGAGNAIYPQVREFEMRWGLANQAEVQQLIGFFNAVGFTGTHVVDLPQWNSTTYVFKSYTGCIIDEPDVNTYFTEYSTDLILLVSNIIT